MTRNLTYTYNAPKPHAVSEVGGTSISYDKNGNPIVLESDTLFRYMVWDEENRLTCLTDDSYRSIYTYNHVGERVVKSHGPTESAYINGALQGVIHHNENTYTIYVNPFLVQTAQGFTKHIYNGNQRIATKLGTGEFKNRFVQDNYTQTAGNKDYIQKLNAIEHSREAYVKGHNTPPGVPTQKGLTGDVEFISEAYPVVEFGNYDIPEGWENALAKPTQTGVPAQWENPNTTGFETSSEEETNLYFFHTDHLGSTNYLTDKDGVVQQSIVYQPYGEVLYEEKTYSNPYKFNGKELDTETGLAYYGARYYSPELSVWYGVDPLMEKYPNSSPYVFCAGNPVKLVDPDGRKVWDNKNIRDAERYAKKVGGTIKRWIGRNGYEHASVTKLYSSINSDGGYDVTVSTKAFLGTKSNQHNVLYNTAESLLGTSNSLDGKADPANLGTCTKQDVMVASGVIGTIIGGVSILAEGMSIMTGMAFLNSIDDVGTNIKGESISQQVVKKEKGKKIVGKIKTGINLLSIIGSSTTIHRTNDVVEKTIETTNIINTTTNEYINNKKNE